MKKTILVVSAFFALSALPALAQYKEMNKVETLAKSSNEQQMLSGLSKHLGVSSEVLKQEMTNNNLNFGQLYLAHTIAKESKADFITIVSDSKTKLWTTIIEERKVDKKHMAADVDELERTIKNSGSTK
ncbi:MAG TPA: hypothetical protein VFO86_07775 [Terriglobia bacterium]|nr:hypothetical protein [Terriglobia bacterium]